MKAIKKIDWPTKDAEMYNESVRKFEELYNHDMEIAKREAEISELKSSVRILQRLVDDYGTYDAKGRMLELIEKKCAEHEGLMGQWTDFLMTLKLAYPDIETEFKQVTHQ